MPAIILHTRYIQDLFSKLKFTFKKSHFFKIKKSLIIYLYKLTSNIFKI